MNVKILLKGQKYQQLLYHHHLRMDIFLTLKVDYEELDSIKYWSTCICICKYDNIFHAIY